MCVWSVRISDAESLPSPLMSCASMNVLTCRAAFGKGVEGGECRGRRLARGTRGVMASVVAGRHRPEPGLRVVR